MKKLIALTLALLMLTMSFVACNSGETETTTEAEQNQTEAPVDTTEAVVELPYKSAVELLQIIFEKYNATATEDTMLYVCGGNINNFDTTCFSAFIYKSKAEVCFTLL